MRHSSYLEVNLSLLGDNFENIQKLAPKAKILPMVKADAYGNGLLSISRYLVREHAVETLGCATLGEALTLLRSEPNLDSRLIIFSDTELSNNDAQKEYSDLRLIPVLYQRSDLEIVLKNPGFKNTQIFMKLNTGMNRLGLKIEDIEPYLPQLKERGIQHLISHFARSSELLVPGDKTSKQIEEFCKTKKFLLDAGVEIRETSLSNSGAIEQGIGIDETYIRPGLMLYGPPSVSGPVIWRGNQVSRFITKILTTFQVKKGTPIGYGVNVADKDSFIAVLPVGYGDGILSYYSGSYINVRGHRAKLFGHVNMDMTFLQFDPSAEKDIRNESPVEIWNHDNLVITDLAAQNKTTPYQLMCAISGRIPRIYKVK